MSEDWEDISSILTCPISNQISFLESLTSKVFSTPELPEKYEATLTKCMVYLTSWIILPQLSYIPNELPTSFTELYSQLNVDTSSLYLEFIEKYRSRYIHRSNLSTSYFTILYNEITLSLLLAIPCKDIFEVLSSEDCIPPLLWLLTYSPSLRNTASTLLTQAIMKQDGVYYCIKSISRGDDKDTLRRFITSIISAIPKSVDSKSYARNITEQMLSMVCKEDMDAYFENIVSESLHNIITKAGDTVRDILDKHLIWKHKEILNTVIKGLSRCVKREPPSSLVMFILDRQWEIMSEVNWFLRRYRSLEICKAVKDMIVQQLRYSEISGSLLYSAISKSQFLYQFSLDENMNIIPQVRPDHVDIQSWLESITELLEDLKHTELGQKVIGEVFSLLILNYSSSSFSHTYVLIYILENVREEMLLASSDSIISFLKLNLQNDDTEVLLISLNILETILDKFQLNTQSKLFLIEITPRILFLTKHTTREIRVKALCINEIISQIYSHDATEISKSGEDKLDVIKAISSKQAYERGYGYFKLCNMISTGKFWKEGIIDIISPSLAEEEIFVFDQALKVWIACGMKDLSYCVRYLINKGKEIDEIWMIERVNEILYIIIKEKGILIHNHLNDLVGYVHVLIDKKQDQVISSCLMVLSQLCKCLKSGIHPHLYYICRTAINYIKTYTARLPSSSTQQEGLKASLVILEKIMNCLDPQLITPYLPEIAQALEILTLSDIDSEEIRTLIHNTQQAYDSLSEIMIGESVSQIPYLLR